ncbi:hydroxyacid dehydrogenase [bacterium]|nr:hydroxyacid dehydrogenase [bacterium]
MSSNKYKVLVVQGLHEQGLEMLKQRSDIEFKVLLSDDENEILEAAKDVNGITVRTAQITEKIINSSKNLQVISRHGVGYDSINLKSLNNKKIPLTIAAHSNMISVSEQAMFFLLALNKNIFYYDDFTRKGDWTNRWDVKAWDLAGKNIMVIGFGRIGSNFVKRALAFDMNVYVYDPYVDHKKIKKSGAIAIENFKDNLSKMDAITLHCPKNEKTTNLFTKKEFQKMKKDAFIINCARGGILNEEDLYQALLNEKIAGAGLDVFDVEPTPSSNLLFKLKNVILSPHIAGVTVESTIRMATETVQNVLDVFDNKVNKSVVVNLKEIGMK